MHFYGRLRRFWSALTARWLFQLQMGAAAGGLIRSTRRSSLRGHSQLAWAARVFRWSAWRVFIYSHPGPALSTSQTPCRFVWRFAGSVAEELLAPGSVGHCSASPI